MLTRDMLIQGWTHLECLKWVSAKNGVDLNAFQMGIGFIYWTQKLKRI